MNLKIAQEKTSSGESQEWVAEILGSGKSCRGSSYSEALGRLVKNHMKDFGIDLIQFGHAIPIESFSFGPGFDPNGRTTRRATA